MSRLLCACVIVSAVAVMAFCLTPVVKEVTISLHSQRSGGRP